MSIGTGGRYAGRRPAFRQDGSAKLEELRNNNDEIDLLASALSNSTVESRSYQNSRLFDRRILATRNIFTELIERDDSVEIDYMCTRGYKPDRHDFELAANIASCQMLRVLAHHSSGTPSSALISAITRKRDPGIIQLLCTLGCRVTFATLITAIDCGESSEIVQYLCERRPDVNGFMWLIVLAINHDRGDLIEILVAKWLRTCRRSASQSHRLIDYSIAQNKLPAVHLLYESGCSFGPRSLKIAVAVGNVAMIQYLCTRGCTPSRRLIKSAIDICQSATNAELIIWLCDFGGYSRSRALKYANKHSKTHFMNYLKCA